MLMLCAGCGSSGEASEHDAGRGGVDSGGSSGSGATTSDSGATGGAGGSGGTGGSGEASTGCPSGRPGPALIEIPAPGGGSYCIDATEVTNADYAAFVAEKNGDTSGQDPRCEWNTSYVSDTLGGDTHPASYVDWCDAFAYCKWAGKRLCGKIGGGPNAFADFADPTKSQWMNACSAGGTRSFPLGGTVGCAGGLQPSPVASSGCEGGYPGVFDMSGNVWEWEDSCDRNANPAADPCRMRGGAYTLGGRECAYGRPGDGRGILASGVGFRCCSG
jgi:formylglycine-generating enzyme